MYQFLPGLGGGPIISAHRRRTLVTLGSVLLAIGYMLSVFTYNYHVAYLTLYLQVSVKVDVGKLRKCNVLVNTSHFPNTNRII